MQRFKPRASLDGPNEALETGGTMGTTCIQLFGRFTVVTNAPVEGETLPLKAQELLAYILLYRERWHSRERLAVQLWPDSNTLEARARLRRLIWKIHDGLRDIEEQFNTRLLNVREEWIGLNPNAGFTLDIEQFETNYQQGQHTAFPDISADLARSWHAAVDLYHGDLLEDWDFDWCIIERERFKIMLLAMLSKLVNYHIAHDEFEQGILSASQILRVDRAHEGAHRQLMRMQYAAGNRTGALRQFRLCEASLLEELDVQPGKATIRLYEQIRREETALEFEVAPTVMNSFPGTAISDLYARIEQLQTVVLESHRELNDNLRLLRLGQEKDP